MAIGTDQPKEKGPIGCAKAGQHGTKGRTDCEGEIGAPGQHFAMRKVGKAQDGIGERDAYGTKADDRAIHEAIHDGLQGHWIFSLAQPPR